MTNRRHALKIVAQLLSVLVFVGCHSPPAMPVVEAIGAEDEIIVAGKPFHTGTHVITWTNPAGYNGYKSSRAFTLRQAPRSVGETKRLEAKEWDLGALQKVVDQLVLHYDGHGVSKSCFEVLQERGLSIHFMLDIDGTVYQTLDVQERALHATTSNDRSIGIELANIGAFPPGERKEIGDWYRSDAQKRPYIQIPIRVGPAKLYTKEFVGRPARPELIEGFVQGIELVQYDLTPEQYAALIKLTATLCRLFPQIKCDYPKDGAGQLITHKIPDEQLAKYKGILGHFHIQANKTDPGPALQWDKVIAGASQAQQ